MHLQSSHRGHDHYCRRLESAHSTLDIQELLRPTICAKASFSNHIISQLHGDLVGQYRVGADSDVGERAGVHKDRAVVKLLAEVRLDGVLHQHGHRASGIEVLRRHGIAVAVVGDLDTTEALADVGKATGQRQDSHNLGGHGNIKLRLAWPAATTATQADDYVAQRHIIHIHTAVPTDAERVNIQRVIVPEAGVNHRRQQVIGCADGVNVTGEVQVDLFHRHCLRVPSAAGAALDPESRAHRRLAHGRHGLLPDMAHGLGQAQSDHGFALSQRGRRNGGDQNEFGIRLVGQPVEGRQVNLGYVVAVQLQFLALDPRVAGYVYNGAQFGLLGNF